MPQRQIPTPHPPIGGLVQGFLYPTPQPPIRALARQQPPATPALPIHGASVAGTTDTYTFPAIPRPLRRSFRIGSTVAVHTGTIRDVTTDTQLTYLQLQPDRQRLETQPVRYRQDVWNPQYSVLAPTISQDFWTSPVPVPGPVVSRTWSAPWTPLEGPPVAGLPADIFVLNLGPSPALASYWQRPKPVITIRGIRGPAVPVPQSAVVPLSPDDRWWHRLIARPVPVIPVWPGPPTLATFLYPPAQPDRQHWYVRRLAQFTAPGPRTDGAEPQALSLFTLTQPQGGWTRDRLVSRFVVTPQLLGAFTPPPAAQTYLYPPAQPGRARWYVPRTPSEQVPAPLLVQQGATVTATVPIPGVSGSLPPLFPWPYAAFAPGLTSPSPIVWSVIIAPIIVPLAAADACDTFTVAAEPGRFTVAAELGALFTPADKGSFTVGAEPGSFTVPGCDTE